MMSIRSTSFSPATESMSETKVAPITQVDLSFLSEGLYSFLTIFFYYQHPFLTYRVVIVNSALPFLDLGSIKTIF